MMTRLVIAVAIVSLLIAGFVGAAAGALWTGSRIDGAIEMGCGLVAIVLLAAALWLVWKSHRQILRIRAILEQEAHWLRHEHNNCAAGMGVHVQALRAQGDLLGGRAREALETLDQERLSISRSSDAIQRLAEAMLRSVGAGSGLNKMRKVELELLLDDAVVLLENQADEKNSVLLTSLDEAAIVGDDSLIAMMAGNLIQNAIKYTPRGGTIAVVCNTQNGFANLWIEDSGPGIPEDMRGEVFRPAVRLAATASERGSGFGLALVEEIVRLHRGRVSIGSSNYGGASFYVRFPAA